jgi:hypothetical protein
MVILIKVIEEIKKKGWKVLSITEDHNTNQKFYNVEKKFDNMRNILLILSRMVFSFNNLRLISNVI